MRLIKAIFRHVVDLLFLGVTIFLLVMYFVKGETSGIYWLVACAIYVMGNIYNKARLSIWMEDNNIKNNTLNP